MANKDQALNVDMTGGLLTIAVGVSELCHQLRGLSALGTGREDCTVVTDEDVFVRAIVQQLRHADDRGFGPIHDLLNDAAADAIEAGCGGVRLRGDA